MESRNTYTAISLIYTELPLQYSGMVFLVNGGWFEYTYEKTNVDTLIYHTINKKKNTFELDQT